MNRSIFNLILIACAPMLFSCAGTKPYLVLSDPSGAVFVCREGLLTDETIEANQLESMGWDELDETASFVFINGVAGLNQTESKPANEPSVSAEFSN
ncbi:MAG: hypothetical protein ACI8TQ_002668 [Planctomycetota bacterium]|jgi:hypothetical protein